MVFYFKYFFLLGLIVLAVNQFLNNAIITQYTHYITGIIIALGFLTFFASKNIVEREIGNKKTGEELEEFYRNNKFNTKFPTIAKLDLKYGFSYAIKKRDISLFLFCIFAFPFILFLKSIFQLVRLMYKIGWWYSFMLILIVLISFSFMLLGLGNFLTVDESRWINTGDVVKLMPVSYEESLDSNFIDNSYARSELYWDCYLHGRIGATFNNANPSATLNFLHLPAYLFRNYLSFEEYLFLARLTIIIHNLILVLILFLLIKKITSKRNSILFLTSLVLLPQFIGYSRIINHDSIQGLYILGFILSIWLSLNTQRKKYYIISGIFYSLALFTQYKSAFIMVLLFTFPLLYSYLKNDFKNINYFFKNLSYFYFSAIITAVVILPAVIIYPQLLIKRLFFYNEGLVGFVYVLVIIIFAGLMNVNKSGLIDKIKNYEIYFIRSILLLITIIFFYVILNSVKIINLIYNNIGSFESAYTVVFGSYGILFFCLPIILIIFLFIRLYFSFKSKNIDFSFILISLFFILIFFAILQSRGVGGYILMDIRYLYVFLPILIAGIFINNLVLSKKVFNIVFLLLIISLVYANFIFSPFYIFHNNIFLPEGYLVSRTTWALDTGDTSKYINQNFNNVTVYNPRGRIEYFLKGGIKVIPWYSNFWEYEPDYIIVEWEKDHKFTKIFDYYRENEDPVWYIQRNGVVLTGIYKFNKELNYEEILNT